MSRILIIDDDERIRWLLRRTLECAGHEVEVACNGIDGMKLARAWLADLVITDLVMPEKEGIETIMELRRENAGTPIIAISGGGHASAEEYLHVAKKLGARHTLAKPFSREEILEAVRSALSDGKLN